MAKKKKQILMKHRLVPKFEIVNGEELDELKNRFGDISKFPKIFEDDPVSVILNAKPGDIIKFYRKSYVDGREVIYYRYVVKR